MVLQFKNLGKFFQRGAGGGSRTHNPLRATHLKCVAYANSATPACYYSSSLSINSSNGLRQSVSSWEYNKANNFSSLKPLSASLFNFSKIRLSCSLSRIYGVFGFDGMSMRRGRESNPRIWVLQTHALPLSNRAVFILTSLSFLLHIYLIYRPL